ncbi:MAG TPA: NADPH-dependent FMN reductase [Solirubrobacteraceae bacterium]|jgi:NAD(P)H-dependent FMN reductase|nr:NADPH-dependent FMN reductase [Solirubrobacteraceae bacterium]
MDVLCIVGSAASRSHTGALVGHLAKRLQQRGHAVRVWDLAEDPLPLADPLLYWSDDPHPHPAARAFIAAVADADALVLGSATHHASYSGVIKNALDHLWADAFANRPVALASNAGGVRGSSTACEHLRSVVKALAGWATPTQVTSCDDDFLESEAGRRLVNEAVRRRCEAIVDELARCAIALRAPDRADDPEASVPARQSA